MKKIIFSFLFGLLGIALTGQTYNLNVSGTVIDELTLEPIADHPIYISIPGDSLVREFFYFSIVLTDANGYYSDTINVDSGEEGVLFVETTGCNGIFLTSTGQFSKNNSSFEFDFETCSWAGGGEDCEAWFSYYPIDNDLSLQFEDYSFGNPTSWSWDFGDGQSSDEQNPLHTYAAEGEYMVSLEISSDSGDCSSIMFMPVYVGVDTIWPGECMAMFCYYPDSLEYFSIAFSDMSFGPDGNMADSWFWEFGDGTSSVEQNPIHSYNAEGQYVVCLTIITVDPVLGDSCSSTYCSDVYVQDWENNCEAWFYYYPAGDSFPNNNDELVFQFVDYSWGNPDSWSWDFGDGSTSTEQNPIHEYDQMGVYDVCLTISSDSCTASYCEAVYAWIDTTEYCFSWFTYQIEELTVDFTAFSEGNDNSVNYTWEFGDGTTATGQIVEHIYDASGIYTVYLTAESDSGNCFSTYVETVWVGEDFAFIVNGNVFLEDSIMADFADVYLMTFDTLGNDLINVATTQIDEYGYYEFEDVSIENCIYFVQAELTDLSAFYGDYVPTYHFSSMYWEYAMPVFPFPMGYSYDIYMIGDSAITMGNGNIYGVVNGGNSRDIMSNIEILLMTESGSPITYLRTDENGEFQFPELDYGTYLVYTEIVGIQTTAAVVNITEDKPDANIVIEVANGEATLGINQRSAYIEEVSNISPNPVKEDASLNIILKEASSVSINIINQYGQILSSENLELNSGENIINLQTTSIETGVYIVNIVSEDAYNTTRKFVKLR